MPSGHAVSEAHPTETPNRFVPLKDRPVSSNSGPINTFSEKFLNPAISSSGMGNVGETYEVNISCILNPTYFWAQNAESLQNMKRLQHELNCHYNSTSYPPFKPLLNSFCVCMYRSAYCRVFVRDKTSQRFVVVSVDTGYQFLADEKCLRPLDAKFCGQPFRAVLCSLAHVQPADGKLWTEEAKKYCKNKVCSKIVKIRVIFNSKSRLFVDVFDPDSSEGCSLNTLLIANGLARRFNGGVGKNITDGSQCRPLD